MRGEVKTIRGKRVASPEYRSWQMMKNRCLNPNAYDWDYYGGRGISITPAWLWFEAFLADMGRRPTLLHTLDRLDSTGHYSKANCRWATREEQARNREYCKLTAAMAAEIRQLYSTGNFYQDELAARFGVSQATISQVCRDLTWRVGREGKEWVQL